MRMTGSASTGPSGSSFSHSESNTDSDSFSDYGNVTVGTIVAPFSESEASSATYRYSVTGPPDPTTYQESVYSSTLTGETPLPACFTETDAAGHADSAGSTAAGYAGESPADSAEHLGTTPGALDTTDGLAAAMGGLAVHCFKRSNRLKRLFKEQDYEFSYTWPCYFLDARQRKRHTGIAAGHG
jgi:hypothetical protein